MNGQQAYPVAGRAAPEAGRRESMETDGAMTVSMEAEMGQMKAFTMDACFDVEICRDQLRCLWTAYCIHHDLEADTSRYDSSMKELWDAISQDEACTADWDGYDSFYCYLAKYLV
jgi:hypothetical protein